MIEPVKLTLSMTAEADMKAHLRRQVRSIREGLREIHTEKLPRWRKAYEAAPAEEVREWPFHGASNLIVPVIAIHADTLLARVMAAVMKTQPPWVARLLGKHPEEYDQFRLSIETFMQYVGLEPEELDLYRVYKDWFGDIIRLGTGVVKAPMHKIIEDIVIPTGDGTGSFDTYTETKYSGPRPEKVRFEHFGMSPNVKTLEAANFKYHLVQLERFDLEERAFRREYDPKAVAEVLKQPDRTTPGPNDAVMQESAGARVSPGYGYAEYDIYECHFRYRVPRVGYTKLLVWYHEKSNTILRAYYYYYPCEIFVGSRLFFRDDFWFGYGFCEMLDEFQEEISTIHNQRRDNQTIANTKTWRVSPDSKLHKGYRVFPGAMLPAEKDEIEPLQHGEVSALAIDEERLALELAEKRSGVSGPLQGMGAGTNNKRGIYSAMGTLSLMQEGNTRTDLNVTDIRYAHTKLGRILLHEYAEYGIGSRAAMFGEMGETLKKALDLFKSGRIALPVYASTASVNREVEKQNDLLLSNVMQKHYQVVASMLGASANMTTPPAVKEYMTKAVQSAETLMKAIMRHFGYDEVDRLVPEAPKGAGAPPMGAPGTAPGMPVGGGQPAGGPGSEGLLAGLMQSGGQPQ